MTPIRYNAYQKWQTEIIATAASGATFTPLGNYPCDEVVIYNPASGVKLDIIASSQLDLAKFVTIDAPAGATIPVGGNANEIMVRRNDQSNTPDTVRFIWRRYQR